jgi:predicted PurR-regulated permease PerM
MMDREGRRRYKQEPEPEMGQPQMGQPVSLPDRAARISAATTLAVTAVVMIFLYLIRGILLPFVLAGVVAYVCTPLIDRLATQTRWPRWLFALAALLGLMALATLLCILGGPALLEEIRKVAGDLQGSLTRLLSALMGNQRFNLMGEPISAGQIAAHAAESFRDWLARSGGGLLLAVWTVTGLSGLLLIWVLLGYLLFDAPRLAKGLFWLVPPQHRPFVSRVWRDLDPLLRRYFIGVALVVAYASVVAYIGLGLILGLHHALFLALLTGILEMLPVIGPVAAAVIAGLVATQEATSAWNILAYILYATVLRISIDQFVGPIVLGRASHLRPVLVIFCFLSGGILFGTVGVILAIPVALCIKVVLATLYEESHTGSQG